MTRSALSVWLLLLPSVLLAQEPKQKPLLSLNVGGHTAPIFETFFAPDGKSLWSAAEDHTIRQWDVATGEALRVLRIPASETQPAVSFSRDGRFLAIAIEEEPNRHWISLLSLADLKVTRLFKGHKDIIISVAFSPDGKLLASCDWKNSVRLWDVTTGKQLFDLPPAHVQALAFSIDGKLLASARFDNHNRTKHRCSQKTCATRD
jgi:WD40 repeat protein